MDIEKAIDSPEDAFIIPTPRTPSLAVEKGLAVKTMCFVRAT